MTLEMTETFAIGRKLVGSVLSSPSRLRMNLFWVDSRTPSKMYRLQSVVRRGSSMSTYSCNRNVGRGSSSYNFGAASKMARGGSAGSTAITADRLQVVGGNAGGGE